MLQVTDAVLSADFNLKSVQGYISSVSPVLTQLHLASKYSSNKQLLVLILCVAFALCLVELTPECAFDLADLLALDTEVSSITYDCWCLICIWSCADFPVSTQRRTLSVSGGVR
jgi:hypothetical protein